MFCSFSFIFINLNFSSSSKSESRSVLSNSLWPHGLNTPLDSPGQNTGVGSLSLLQGIFPILGSNSGLPHCRQILYQLSHKGSPNVLKWAAFLFSSSSFWPRNQTRVSFIPPELWGKPIKDAGKWSKPSHLSKCSHLSNVIINQSVSMFASFKSISILQAECYISFFFIYTLIYNWNLK